MGKKWSGWTALGTIAAGVRFACGSGTVRTYPQTPPLPVPDSLQSPALEPGFSLSEQPGEVAFDAVVGDAVAVLAGVGHAGGGAVAEGEVEARVGQSAVLGKRHPVVSEPVLASKAPVSVNPLIAQLLIDFNDTLDVQNYV